MFDAQATKKDSVPRLTRQGVDGKTEVAVLISLGFGAGWSTWNQEVSDTLLFHKSIVDFVLSHDSEDSEWVNKLDSLVRSIIGEDECVYAGGAEGLEVCWVPEGTRFWVSEYDGAERLRTIDEFNWSVA